MDNQLSPVMLNAVTAAVAELNANLHPDGSQYTVEGVLSRYRGTDLDNWLIFRNHHPVYREENE